MGIQERKEREKEQRRKEILDAAESIFFAKGLNNATMDEVAEKAELSKGTVYLYFKSKEDLFFATTSRGADIMRSMFQEAFDLNGTGRDKLMAIGQAYLKFAIEYKDYFNAMMYHQSHTKDCKNCPNENCKDKDGDIILLVAKAIELGQTDGTVTTETPSIRLAHLLWGQTTGVIELITREKIHLDHMGISVDDIIDDYYQLLIRGLRAS